MTTAQGGPRWERPALVALLLVAAALLLRPVLGDPLGLALGAAGSEAPRHFWGLWATLAHLDAWGPFVAHLELDHPSGYTRHLMDPVNLLFFAPGYLLGGGGVQGATLGWNLLHAAWAVVGGLGGWLLARWWLGGRPGAVEGALFAAFACATAPYLMASPWLGRSEMLPGVAWPLHLWCLVRLLAVPPGRRRATAGWVLAAGGSLGLIALGGWYLAAWLMLLDPPVALWLAARAGRRPDAPSWRARLLRLVGVGAVATLLLLPALQALLAHPPPILAESQRVSVHMGICTPPWLLLPFTGNVGLPGTDLPAYPGTVLFLLAVAGAVLDRRARPWLLVALVLLVVSLGPFLVWSNDAGELTDGSPPRLPAWYLEMLLPPVRFIWGWCRLGILLTGPLALAAASAAAALVVRAREIRLQLGIALLVALAIDHGHDRAPAGIDASAFDPRPPADLLAAVDDLPPGALLQLPFDDHYMTWQLAHGRPVAESLEIEDVRGSSYTVQQATRLMAAVRAGEEPPAELWAPSTARCVRADGLALQQAGYAAIVLHRDRLPDAHLPLTRWLTAGLGQPVVDTETLGIWLAQGQVQPGLDCPLSEVRAIIPGAESVDAATLP